MAPDWSSLPLDVLSIIALKLESFEEFFYFSVVCRWWNRASSSIKHGWRARPTVPWLLLAENTKENPNCIRKIFNLNNTKCYNLSLPQTFGRRCWGSAYGWIAMIDHDYSVRLFNPITKAEILFPSLETIASYSNNFDKNKDSDRLLQLYFTKLIVLKVPRSGQYEFVIMVVYDFSKGLAFARHEDESWTSVLVKKKVVRFGKIMSAVRIVDVVEMGDQVFALYDDGEIVCWNAKKFQDLEPLKTIDYIPSETEIFVEYRKWFGTTYLVRSGTDLLMLLRYKEQVLSPDDPTTSDLDIVYRTVYIQVYKLDPKDKRWHEIEDVGDVALFVGCNYSMSVSVLEATCLQRNCVYFNDDENECWADPTEFGGHDMGVYDIQNDEIWRFYQGQDTRSSTCPPIWFVPEL
ncbi:F-box protein KIB4-like [Silene latifolia]|uniref:F-box protein KIB4-like n=1 Tax=Silene latifolia TaxID=37657 RepID=UPI003D77AF7C